MQKNTSIEYVIFDLDDTLYPQIEFARGCLMNTAEFISGLSGIPVEKIKIVLNSLLESKGVEYRYIFNDLFNQIQYDGMPFIKEILNIYWKSEPEIVVYPDAYSMLNTLYNNYNLYMISDGYQNIQRYKINKLGLNKYFKTVYITDDYGIDKRKPSNYVFELFLKESKAAPEKCVYVGNDPRRDFFPARQSGMRSIRITQGEFCNLIPESGYQADLSIPSISQLYECLLTLK